MRVVLDLGHTATGLPPAQHAGLSERRIVWRYGLACADALDRAGVEVALAGANTYTNRQYWAATWGANLYLALHVNAGWQADLTPRAALFHNAAGLRAAEDLAHALAPLAGGCRLWPVPDTAWASNAHALVSRLGGRPGVVVEPGYIDCPEHAHLWQADGPDRLGEAIALGLLAHFSEAA